MDFRKLFSRMLGWVYSAGLKVYLFFKPKFLPFIVRSPRVHRFFFFSKEAAKAILYPGAVAPPNEQEVSRDTTASFVESGNCILRSSRIPGWLREEWKKIHLLEPSTFPNSDFLESVGFYHVPHSRIAEPYLRLREDIGEGISHVYLVPWLRKGGADLVTLNMVRALLDASPESRPSIIATLDVASEWKRRLPRGTKLIEFGRNYGYLSREERETLLARCLLQTAPKAIHNINSDLGYDLFAKYGAAFSDASRLFASSFCGDMCPEGRMIGYPFGPLDACFDYLTAVISDNQAHIDQMVRMYGMEREKFFLHYQPAPSPIHTKRYDDRCLGKATLDVLWAGRIDRQKRPDILLQIAEACRELPIRFNVFGSSVLDDDVYSDAFGQLENVFYHGPFEGLTSLNVDAFDVFLNTSQWDGMPNILLEAMSMGIPVISSAVGGIPELIREGENGFLVLPFDKVSCYKSLLSRIHCHRKLLVSMGTKAMEIVRFQHSWERFQYLLNEIPFYL
jgi:glycosyltransferase involved in cell wall biosynthesis